ncbi:hypothetical protein ACN6KF_002529 [Labrys sp. La1]|uniref:hypothetical protein n=1 Tax=Labrys sp. La1 TaxID=3404917 RepID=UPI003EBF1C4C
MAPRIEAQRQLKLCSPRNIGLSCPGAIDDTTGHRTRRKTSTRRPTQTFDGIRMNETTTYPYRPKSLLAALATGFFLLCALFMGHEALNNHVGLVINGLIELDSTGATGFYWLIALLSLGLVAFGLASVRASLMPDRNVTLAPNAVIIPASILSRATTTIPLADIVNLSLQTGRYPLLHIHHNGGTTKLAQRFFEDKDRFGDFLARLQAAIQALNAASQASVGPTRWEDR